MHVWVLSMLACMWVHTCARGVPKLPSDAFPNLSPFFMGSLGHLHSISISPGSFVLRENIDGSLWQRGKLVSAERLDTDLTTYRTVFSGESGTGQWWVRDGQDHTLISIAQLCVPLASRNLNFRSEPKDRLLFQGLRGAFVHCPHRFTLCSNSVWNTGGPACSPTKERVKPRELRVGGAL